MNEKTVRYCAICVGAAITLAILYVNDGSFSRHGLFASNIKDTAAFDILRQISKEFTRSSTARDLAQFLWEDGVTYTFDSTTRVSTIANTFTVELWLSYEFFDGRLKDVEEEGFSIAGVSGGIEVAVEENEVEWY